MKTKEEVIQIAWDLFGVDSNESYDGWISAEYIPEEAILSGMLDLKNFRTSTDYDEPFYRPKSLQGIESNNGWISINSEKDLPTIGTFYTILSFDENIVEREFPHPKFTLEFNKEWWLKYVTHYQEKIMPNKPLHK